MNTQLFRPQQAESEQAHSQQSHSQQVLSNPSHPPEPLALLTPAANRVARTSLLDRAAMRVGLWLVLWGSRPLTDVDALEQHQRRLFHAEQRARLEADAAYATRLWMHGA